MKSAKGMSNHDRDDLEDDISQRRWEALEPFPLVSRRTHCTAIEGREKALIISLQQG